MSKPVVVPVISAASALITMALAAIRTVFVRRRIMQESYPCGCLLGSEGRLCSKANQLGQRAFMLLYMYTATGKSSTLREYYFAKEQFVKHLRDQMK
jgi:hypothetical protein